MEIQVLMIIIINWLIYLQTFILTLGQLNTNINHLKYCNKMNAIAKIRKCSSYITRNKKEENETILF